MTASPEMIDRAYVRLDEGPVHMRRMEGEGRPLYLVHLSPLSSRSLEPLMLELRNIGFRAPLIAPDTLGNGQSVRPAPANPNIAYFADSMRRVLDALGIDKVDVFGSHTGARTACEFALNHSDRVGRLVLDGITEYSADRQELFRQSYMPVVKPDMFGSQLSWAFHYMRNQHIFSPWFMQNAENCIGKSLPSAEELHIAALELLSSLDTYHLAYAAAFAYPADSRVPALTTPSLLLKADDQGASVISASADRYANGRNISATTAVGEPQIAEAIMRFLTTDA